MPAELNKSEIRDPNEEVLLRSEIRDPNEELIIIMTKYSLRERSYKFSVELVKFQLIRSGTSIGANAEEADSSSSRKDFRKLKRSRIYWMNAIKACGSSVK